MQYPIPSLLRILLLI